MTVPSFLVNANLLPLVMGTVPASALSIELKTAAKPARSRKRVEEGMALSFVRSEGCLLSWCCITCIYF